MPSEVVGIKNHRTRLLAHPIEHAARGEVRKEGAQVTQRAQLRPSERGQIPGRPEGPKDMTRLIDDPSLVPWVRKVAGLQITSHALAAALGFALALAGPLGDEPLARVVKANTFLILLASLASLAFALAAGVFEARGIVQRGL